MISVFFEKIKNKKSSLILAILVALAVITAGYIIVTSQAASVVEKPGLLGTYYNNTDFTGTSATRLDPNIDFSWGEGKPHPNIDADTYSVRWTGKLTAPETATYQIFTDSDDGVRVWVEDQLVVNSWTAHPPMENSGSIKLTAGQKYSIKIEFYEQTGSALLRLSWATPSFSKTTIPTSALSTTVTESDPAQTKLIDEAFGSSAANFVPGGGTWTVANGKYNLTKPIQGTTGNPNYSVHRQILTGDFTLKAEAMAANTTSAWDDFSILFGYKDPNNYYFASFNESDDNATNGFFKVVNGTQTKLATFTQTIRGGTLYQIDIKRTGSKLTATLNGNVVGTVNDSTFMSGQVGFGSRNDAASFDNMIVTGVSGGLAPLPSNPTPNPNPNPNPTPTPTPSPTSNTSCPLPAYPKPSCTGVPVGTNLTTDSRCTLSTPNEIIEGKQFNCRLNVTANNVTIKKSYLAKGIDNFGGGGSFILEDSTVGPSSGCDSGLTFGIGARKYTARRVLVRGIPDGFRISNKSSSETVTIEDSYYYSCSNSGDHSDGIQVDGSSGNATIRHNTLDLGGSSSSTAPIFWADFSEGSHGTITNNLVIGGSYVLWLGTGNGHTVTGNRIVIANAYGPNRSNCSTVTTWQDNRLATIDNNYTITSTGSEVTCPR